MARPLPKQGFYVWSDEKFAQVHKLTDEQKSKIGKSNPNKLLNVVYSSGTTKGNWYYDPLHHGDQWNKLLWTCLPSLKDAEDQYDYHETNPTQKDIPDNK